MSKISKLRKKFTAFVNQLSPDQVREQLILAYLQMEQCQRVLRGVDVEPVEMLDNGESSDLELFYQCKKTAEELSYLNEMVSKPDKTIKFGVDVDCSEAINQIKKFYEQLTKIGKAAHDKNIPNDAYVMKVDLRKFYEPLSFDTSNPTDMFNLRKKFKEMAESMKLRVLQEGTEVYFLSKGRIHKSKVKEVIGLEQATGVPVCYVNGHDTIIPATYLYATSKMLVENLKFQKHYSFSSEHESAYFIDNTSRVFLGAKWYLDEQKIKNFVNMDDLRKFLIENIVDDGEKR